tara:strand:- start:15 stop:1112 length:1098 start_codon:yes stop_codon:yes gene_type:complete
MDNLFTSLGLMSGTSLDGIDASIILSDGEEKVEIIENQFVSYPNQFRENLRNYIKNIYSKDDILKSKDEYFKIERDLTLLHSQISSKIIEKNNHKIDLIGFHGHTVIHRPKLKYSIQMGDPNLLSQLLKSKIIFNFRKKDIYDGGDGAPLAPVYHKSLIKKLHINEPVLFLNIGGISNYTYCDREKLLAKDIGPGNVLVDEYLKKTKNINFDKDGKIAAQGKVDKNIVNQFIEHDIYNSENRQSYDRSEFDFNFVKGLNIEDAVATLTFFTASIITNYINTKFKKEFEIILCGGGRKNITLINNLKKLSKNKIKNIDDYNINGDFIESQAFAYLAIRSFLKKNLSYPLTTKVKKPTTGGEIFKNF